jgi:hypothetical protein
MGELEGSQEQLVYFTGQGRGKTGVKAMTKKPAASLPKGIKGQMKARKGSPQPCPGQHHGQLQLVLVEGVCSAAPGYYMDKKEPKTFH